MSRSDETQPAAVPASTPPKAGSSELTKRVLVALVGAPLVGVALYVGDAVLATLLAMFAALGAREFFGLARRSGVEALTMPGIVASALVPLAVHAHVLGVVDVPPYAPVLVVLALLAAAIWMRGVDGKPLAAAGATVLGVCYVGITLSCAYALRYHAYAIGDLSGMLVVLLPVVLTWASDTGGYFAGRFIGGPKLIPAVSPAKTIAGAAGAVALTVLACAALVLFAVRPYAHLSFTPVGLVLFAVSISVAAQLGDLVESLFKRSAGVKDSGVFFPGHGGVLDRLDSLFFVLPVAYALYDLLLIPAP